MLPSKSLQNPYTVVQFTASINFMVYETKLIKHSLGVLEMSHLTLLYPCWISTHFINWKHTFFYISCQPVINPLVSLRTRGRKLSGILSFDYTSCCLYSEEVSAGCPQPSSAVISEKTSFSPSSTGIWEETWQINDFLRNCTNRILKMSYSFHHALNGLDAYCGESGGNM